MTVILAYVSDDYAFLAADTCRWDAIENRNVGPVDKIHTNSDGALAVGGSNVDRDAFAAGLMTAMLNGEDYVAAASTTVTPLFADKLKLIARTGVSLPQRVVSWHADIDRNRCRIFKYHSEYKLGVICNEWSHQIFGFDCMGPNTAILNSQARAIGKNLLAGSNQLQLDEWAMETVVAISANEYSVETPISVWLMESSKQQFCRTKLMAGSSFSPSPDFLRDVEPSQF